MKRVDRSLLTEVEANRLDSCNDSSRMRRERNATSGACINENSRGTHGPATHGRRCARCHDVHKYGADAVRSGKAAGIAARASNS